MLIKTRLHRSLLQQKFKQQQQKQSSWTMTKMIKNFPFSVNVSDHYQWPSDNSSPVQFLLSPRKTLVSFCSMHSKTNIHSLGTSLKSISINPNPGIIAYSFLLECLTVPHGLVSHAAKKSLLCWLEIFLMVSCWRALTQGTEVGTFIISTTNHNYFTSWEGIGDIRKQLID